MKQSTANAFGALGYSSVLVQWFWSILSVGLPLFTSDFSKDLFLPQQNANRESVMSDITLPNQVEILITVLSVLFAIGLIVYSLLAVPRAIGRGGQKITKKTASAALPHIAHKRKLTKKQKRRLIERIGWTLKLTVVLLPALVLLVPPSAELGLSHTVVGGAGIIFTLISLLAFAIQLLLVKIWRIPNKQVW